MKKINKILLHIYSYKKYVDYLKKIGIEVGIDSQIDKSTIFGSEPYLIKIGDHVRITAGVKFITHDGGVWVIRKKYNEPLIDLVGTITIKNNVHIGMNTIIMPGVTIGNNVIVGCGAIVTKDIPDNEIWAGVPAKFITTIDEYYLKHKNDFLYTKEMNSKEKKAKLIKIFK